MKENTKIDRRKSLERLENDFWADTDLKTSLIEKCYKYRKIPIQDLTIEQIRMLVGQQIGLNYLLPIAFESLENKILAHGDFYKGDLLVSILSINREYWIKNREYYLKISEIIEKGKIEIEDKCDQFMKEHLLKKIQAFVIV